MLAAAILAAAGLYLLPATQAPGGPVPMIAFGGLGGAAILLFAATAAVALGGIYHLPLGLKMFLALGSGASFAILLTFPPHLALIPTCAGTIIAQIVTRTRRRLSVPTIVFNVAQYVLTWSIVIVLFHRLWGDFSWLPPYARLWSAVIGAALAYMLINTWLVSTWSALRKRTGAWDLWHQILRESWGGYAGTLLLGAVAAQLAAIHPALVVPLLISVLAIYWGQSRIAGMQQRQITTALSSLVETNEGLSPFMHEHSERVAWWSERVARQMGLPESDVETVWFAAKLHDLGMLLLRRDLEATPGILSEAQQALMKQHPAIGAEVLDRLSGMSHVARLVRAHHENYDGTGYPDGLQGQQIPLGARILRVAGSYDALCSTRPHRVALGSDGAMVRISARAGTDYDPQVVRALEQLIKTTDAVPSFDRLFGAATRQPALALAMAAPAAAAGNIVWQAWKSRRPEQSGAAPAPRGQTASAGRPAEPRVLETPWPTATPAVSEAAPYLVAIQETERRRIGRELHDEIGQALTGLKLLLEALPRQPEPRIEGTLENAREMIADLMTRVHDISLELRPAELDDLGLLPALQWHVKRYQSKAAVRVAFTHSGLNRRFSTGVETAAYRIAQEALTNVARHAHVPDVRLRVCAADGALSVEIEDEGRGFDPASVESNGLVGMRERALLVGGRLAVDTAPGRGTRITATLPITTAEVPRQAQ